MFLRRIACSNEDSVRKFLTFYRRLCSRAVWWPLWNGIIHARSPDADSELEDDSDTQASIDMTENNIPADVTGYDSDASSSDPSSSYSDTNSDPDARLRIIRDSDYDADSGSFACSMSDNTKNKAC